MKTFHKMVLALGAAVVLGSTGLYAQQAVANIPFDFTVQGVTMPAGEYSVWRASATSNTLQIRNDDTRRSVLLLASNLQKTHKETESAKLIFHRYGDRYFFAEVWSPNGSPRGTILPSKLERELQSGQGTEMASVIVPLHFAGK